MRHFARDAGLSLFFLAIFFATIIGSARSALAAERKSRDVVMANRSFLRGRHGSNVRSASSVFCTLHLVDCR